ncbi:DeoR/GlpR transcriptional regulator [Caulobacter sp. CCUG 60055]|uniref:DeoR/GlpR family DNA-binding transcription regulator n=1 Tax=Caulobacter sp. CCUG 60055 TaxID=2100090 RepID=UPI001FA6FB57|nr:DeoR/GlpR family DNA-binding transcription regulator [Caulobacter sp. CCUG 60055]MBQ1542726.1 DeoR/GlpR transcriptional regulator [Caulobacteraceae bacterium]MCI3179524.1 DeoR/GlpR transcriptional regulator [Caulobacter sp. CCUG 60055]
MHVAEREQLILKLLEQRGFIGFQELDQKLDASAATIRRDLERMAAQGLIERVRGGAKLPALEGGLGEKQNLTGISFHENLSLNRSQKEAIGRAAAALCAPGEAVIIDGGSTTLQMCPHLEPLGLQVLTNSLHIVSALLQQPSTRVSVPAGGLFREQNIILSPFEDDGMGRFHATRLFMGAASVGRHGLMQADTLLVQAERRLLDRAEEIVVLVDSSKFRGPAGHLVCTLEDIDVVVTDRGVDAADRAMLENAGCRVIISD